MNKYSHVSVMGAYINTIRFALNNLEMYLDELGDDILYDNMSSFPEDVLGDDSLFAGYTNPWNPEDDLRNADGELSCKCDECRCKNADPWGVSEDRGESKEEYFDWIDDVLRRTRRAPQDYRMD